MQGEAPGLVSSWPLPTPRERLALSALRTSPQSPSLLLARLNAFSDDTGSLGGLTQPSQGSMRSALDALLVSGCHQGKGGWLPYASNPLLPLIC